MDLRPSSTAGMLININARDGTFSVFMLANDGGRARVAAHFSSGLAQEDWPPSKRLTTLGGKIKPATSPACQG